MRRRPKSLAGAGAIEINQRQGALMALHRHRAGVQPALAEAAQLRRELAAASAVSTAKPPRSLR